MLSSSFFKSMGFVTKSIILSVWSTAEDVLDFMVNKAKETGYEEIYHPLADMENKKFYKETRIEFSPSYRMEGVPSFFSLFLFFLPSMGYSFPSLDKMVFFI